MIGKIFTLFSVCSLAQAQLMSGVKNSLAIDVISQAKDAYFQKIVSLINNIDLPDVNLEGNKGYFRNNKFVLGTMPDHVEFFTDLPNNAVVFKVNDFRGQFFCDDFRYKETIFVAKGRIEVDFKKIYIKVGLGFDVTTLADGRSIPLVKAVDVKMDIDRFDFDIHIHGNIWSDFANLITPFIKGIVINSIEDATEGILNNQLPQIANGVLTKLDGYFPVPLVPHWIVDWETPEAAVVTEDAFSIGVKGLMFDDLYGEEEPAIAVPDMPYYDASNPAKYQAYVSAYSIDGFFNSLIEAVGLHGFIRQSQVPAKLASFMTTTEISILLPGMADYYGAGLPVDIYFNVTSLGDFEVSEADTEMSGLISLMLQFWVTKTDGTQEMAAQIELMDTKFKFTALIDNMNIDLNVTQFNVDKVQVDSDTFGKLNALLIKTKINNGARLGLPFINIALAKHQITIPSNILNLFELSDLVLGYHDNYIFVGATPTFIAPSMTDDLIITQ